jgi:hypothetical protein
VSGNKDLAMPDGPRSRRSGRAALRRLAGFATSIAIAARRVVRWFGPFGVAIAGMFLLMVGVSVGEKPLIAISVLGGLTLLSALELYGERARIKETERWAKLIAGMVSGEGSTTFEVKHTFASLRPELDELIAREVASAMSAFGQDPQGLEAKPASANPKGDAHNG